MVFLESKTLLRFIFFPACIVYLAIVRFVGFDVDINTYAAAMQEFSPSAYYNREFIYWYSANGIYALTQSEFFTFLTFDVIWISLIYLIAKNTKKFDQDRFAIGFLAVLIVSFPLFFGYQNIFRQHIASLVFLLSYSWLEKSPKKAWLIFFASIFIHNTAILMLPIMVSQNFFGISHRYRRVFAVLGSLMLAVALNFVGSYSSVEYSTGVRMEYVYFALFFIAFCVFLVKFRLNLNSIFKLMPSLPISVVLMAGLLLLGHSLVAERIGIMLVILMIYDLYGYSNRIKIYIRRTVFRIGLLLTFSLPVLLFSSSYSFFDSIVAGH